MTTGPKVQTKVGYYEYLARLNKLIDEIKGLDGEIAEYAFMGAVRGDELSEALARVREIVASHVTLAMSASPGT